MMSADDGKTWQKAPVEETPWNIEAQAFNQIDRLLPEKAKELKDPIARGRVLSQLHLNVGWIAAFDSTHEVFCQIRPSHDEYRAETVIGIFRSKDGGKTWLRIRPDQPQEGLAKLLTAPQFLSYNILEIRTLAYDRKRDRLFASDQNGICYTATSKSSDWSPINSPSE
jgi:hypothetical protein